jgi:choline-glycine betaine transporter
MHYLGQGTDKRRKEVSEKMLRKKLEAIVGTMIDSQFTEVVDLVATVATTIATQSRNRSIA